jgi:plastocyanin
VIVPVDAVDVVTVDAADVQVVDVPVVDVPGTDVPVIDVPVVDVPVIVDVPVVDVPVIVDVPPAIDVQPDVPVVVDVPPIVDVLPDVPAVTALNGCDRATATDLTAAGATRNINFPGSGLEYLPPCIRITAGQMVSFTPVASSFASHPLRGGVVVTSVSMTVDPTSPITPTDTGTTAVSFTFPTAGTFGFFCNFHGASAGMKGAVFVDP